MQGDIEMADLDLSSHIGKDLHITMDLSISPILHSWVTT